jgi:hypothetical protein
MISGNGASGKDPQLVDTGRLTQRCLPEGSSAALSAEIGGPDERQLLQQMLGHLTSLAALYHSGVLETGELVELKSLMRQLDRTVKKTEMSDLELTDRVRKKLAKYQRQLEKIRLAAGALEANRVSSAPSTAETPETGRTE